MQLIVGLAPVSSSQIYKQMWQKTPYMRERLAQLEPLMNELDPHEPVNFTVQFQLDRLHYFDVLFCTVLAICVYGSAADIPGSILSSVYPIHVV